MMKSRSRDNNFVIKWAAIWKGMKEKRQVLPSSLLIFTSSCKKDPRKMKREGGIENKGMMVRSGGSEAGLQTYQTSKKREKTFKERFMTCLVSSDSRKLLLASLCLRSFYLPFLSLFFFFPSGCKWIFLVGLGMKSKRRQGSKVGSNGNRMEEKRKGGAASSEETVLRLKMSESIIQRRMLLLFQLLLHFLFPPPSSSFPVCVASV